ncbi:hypothetical protein [Ligilactobacillus equi]|uniref:hypothetical protein n=1 Tax=Ligilactobacillus equi TaxID=137357 RepID=UPI00046AC115|nr:hypothetical protein [Ligilactobacillus equi]
MFRYEYYCPYCHELIYNENKCLNLDYLKKQYNKLEWKIEDVVEEIENIESKSFDEDDQDYFAGDLYDLENTLAQLEDEQESLAMDEGEFVPLLDESDVVNWKYCPYCSNEISTFDLIGTEAFLNLKKEDVVK